MWEDHFFEGHHGLSTLNHLTVDGDITFLPDYIDTMINLKSLYIKSDEIASIPNSIGNMLHLEEYISNVVERSQR